MCTLNFCAIFVYRINKVGSYNNKSIIKANIYAIHNNHAPSYLCETMKSYQVQHTYKTYRATNPNYLNLPIPKNKLYRNNFS